MALRSNLEDNPATVITLTRRGMATHPGGAEHITIGVDDQAPIGVRSVTSIEVVQCGVGPDATVIYEFEYGTSTRSINRCLNSVEITVCVHGETSFASPG